MTELGVPDVLSGTPSQFEENTSVKRVGCIVLAGLALVGLVGCSSSGSKGKQHEDSSAKTATTVSPKTTKADGTNAAPPSTGAIDRSPVPKGTGIIKDVDTKTCDIKPGSVKANGTVTLPESLDGKKVLIMVSWVNATTGTVFASSRTELDDVAAKTATAWDVANVLPDNGTPVRCSVGAIAVD